MPWVAAAAAVAGSYLSSQSAGDQADAARSAADKSSEASKYSADIQKQEYDQTRQDQMPWLNTGKSALNRLAFLMGTGDNGLKTKEQLTQELSPQFTKAGVASSVPSGALGMYRGPMGPNTQYGSTDFSRNADNSTSLAIPRTPPPVYASPTSVSSSYLDQAGLTDAVNKAYAAQTVDPAYGSLNKNFQTHNFSMADLKADPVYQNGLQFGLSEGEKGVNNMAAANGSMLSGATLKALTRYGNDYATTKSQGAYDRFTNDQNNQYNRFTNNQSNQFNRLASLAQVGQTSAGTLAQTGANYANNVSNLSMNNAANQGNALLAGANARAAGYQGVANSLGNVDWSKMFSSNSSNGSNNYATQTQSQGIF